MAIKRATSLTEGDYMYSAKKNKKKQIFDLYKMDYFAKLCVYFVNMV